ncbi:N-acetyl-gamma-glutamyl-phosphate reductase [Flavobacteriaceae bacterium UJ101]|nr:N-acetyl-gamma-glutamyl-phosphate reductase [Flavobacteriaceae bacterium UJ101]
MIKTGIIGGAGYTAGELIRILIHHPEVEIDFIYSTSNAGNPISQVHTDLIGESALHFTNDINLSVDVVFLCLGHGHSGNILKEFNFASTTKVIDLSNEFRLNPNHIFKERDFIYGLPELQKEKIKNADNIANPGCFATAIQLALLPLAKHQYLEQDDLHINAITGSTGAGQSLSSTTHFSWRNNNISSYKVFTHQHLGEINQTIHQLQPDYKGETNFIPLRGDFTRGIFATVYTKTSVDLEEVKKQYKIYYKNDPFTTISDDPIHLKQVVGSNKCILHIDKHDDKLIITSVIDNLIKGASGQAVQNMNLMFGLKETLGLKLKATYF